MTRNSTRAADKRRQRNRAIIALYCDERPIEEIAALFEVTTRTVTNIAKRAGLSRPRGRPYAIPNATEEQRENYRLLVRNFGAAEARRIMGLTK